MSSPPKSDGVQVEGTEKSKPPGKKLSFPVVEDRRRSASCVGHFGRTVLCAVDSSNHSRDAFEWYLKNVWRSDDLVIILYCPEIPSLPSISFSKGLSPPVEKWKEILDEANSKSCRLEEEYETVCREKKLTYKICVESQDRPGESICRVAEKEKAGLIVMGTRGTSTFKRFLIGSVSEYVTRNTRTPCVIVPN